MYVGAAYCYRPSSMVDRFVGWSQYETGKNGELIEIPFGLWTWVGPRNDVLVCIRWGPDPPWEGEILTGGRQAD